MPIVCTAISILIASPGDVAEEREVAKRVVESWNTQRAAATGVVFLPLLWELHAIPEQGDRPQAIINRQIVDHADALIALFWTRLGTPTGIAESGTAEEIEQLKNRGQHVAVYFSKKHSDPYKTDNEEFGRLKAFRNWCSKQGLIDEFTDHGILKEKLHHLLEVLASRFRTQAVSAGASKPVAFSGTKNSAAGSTIVPHARCRSCLGSQRGTSRGPDRVDDANRIMRGISDNLLRVSTSIGDPSQIDLPGAKQLAKDMRMLEQHRIFVDGGKSYKEFWTLGDELLNRALKLIG